jgi:ABC-type transporter Mla subunit MlaD
LRTLLADPAQPHSLPATLANVSRLIDTLLPRLVMLTTSADALLHGVRQDVAGLSTQAGGTLRRLDGTIDDTHDGLKRLLQELNTTMITARLAVLALQRFVETSQGSVVELLSSLRRTADSLQQSTEDLVGRAQKLLTHVDTVVLQNDRNLFTTVENLREVADNLKVASQLVRGNPAVLLWGTNNPNNASPANASSNGAPALQDRGRIGRYDRMP